MDTGQSRAPKGRNEHGVALLLVLAFVVVVGVIIAALLAQGGTTFLASDVTRTNQQRVYRVNSGIEYGLQLLRGEGSFCLTPSGTPGQVTLTIDGGPVTLTCSVSADSSTIGTGGWAAFVNGGSLANTKSGTAVIVGDTYLNGTWGTPQVVLDVVAGHVLWRPTSGGCPAPPPGLSAPAAPTPPFVEVYPLGYAYGAQGGWFTCSTTPVALPAGPAVTAADEPTDGGGAQVVNPPVQKVGTVCRIFSPGVYTDKKKLGLGSVNYFKKGVYVLAFGSEWKIDKYVTGGQPWVDPEGIVPSPQKATGIPDAAGPCNLAVTAPDEVQNPNGVRWLLSGQSRIKIGSNGKLELYPLVDAAHPERPAGTLQALSATDTATWTTPRPASTLTSAQSVLKNDAIANTEIGIHGVLYAPTANLTLLGDVKNDGKTCQSNGSPLTSGTVRSCNNSVLKILGSIVVADLDLNTGPQPPELLAGKLGVDNVAGFGFTRFVLTATSAPEGGGRTVKAVADVALYNTSPISLRVESWRVTNS